jgi:hypothetical protein
MFAFAFVLVLSIAGIGAAHFPSDQSIEARCRTFRTDAVCSEALGRWIGRIVIGQELTQTRKPTHVLDGFSGLRRKAGKSWRRSDLIGTQVVYGEAGPSQGALIYDRQHRLAFYGGGCCAFGSIVLAFGISPPPVRVMDTDLRAVKTDTGLRLGDSPERVTAVYGAAPFRRDAAHPNVAYLLYRNTAPPNGPCVQDQTFGFTGGRLSYIELGSGC